MLFGWQDVLKSHKFIEQNKQFIVRMRVLIKLTLIRSAYSLYTISRNLVTERKLYIL